jgi:outer membrane protein TolC
MRNRVLGARCWVLAAVTALLIAAPLGAQAPAIPRVGFDEAVRQALEKNPSVAQAATSIARAEALLEQARAVTRPTVSAGIGNVLIDHARGFAGGVTQPQDQVTLSAEVSMPVLAPSRWAAVAQARDQIDVSTGSVAQVRQQIAVAAAQAYLAVIAGRREVDVEERALENARAHLDYARKRLEGGAGTQLNQLRAAQSVSSEEARLENTRLALRRAQEALGVLMASSGPIDAGAEPAFEVPAAADESSWLTARPDVRVQTAVIHAAERVVADAWKDWMPTASLSFDPQLVAPKGLFQPSKTWRLSVSLTQPIYSGGVQRAALAVRDITLRQSKLALTDVEIRARAEERLARESLASNERALASARQAAGQATDVLRITTSAFELGATTNLEVIDAQRSARDAEMTTTLAEDAVRRARLDLLVALGRFPK